MEIRNHFTIEQEGETAIALGFFDGVHLGHKGVLDAVVDAQMQGLIPVAFTFTTNNHASPEKKQGVGLLQTLTQREKALEKLGIKYLICPPFESFCDLSPEQFAVDILYNCLRARKVCCGENFRFGKNASANVSTLKALLEPLGVEVHIVPAIEICGDVVSSTRIRDCIRTGNMTLASKLLGSPFSIKEKVVHGKKLGRTIGFPTANQQFPEGLQIPKAGVYATKISIADKLYWGVTNVGYRPTVGTDSTPNAESYVIGMQEDVYGQEMQTEFLFFIREEKKFASLDQLKEAIAKDTQIVLQSVNF